MGRIIKKILLFAFVLAAVITWLGGVWSVSFNPFSLTIQKPEKDFLKRVIKRAEGFVYHEATIHNPPGDVLPDQIDDQMKSEIKKVVN